MGRPETQNRTSPLRALSGISVLENAKERPSAWTSVVFMEPLSTLDPLLTQATLSTQPNLFKEAPWVGQRRKTGPPPLRALSGISVLENATERPSAWPSVVFMEPWSTQGRVFFFRFFARLSRTRRRSALRRSCALRGTDTNRRRAPRPAAHHRTPRRPSPTGRAAPTTRSTNRRRAPRPAVHHRACTTRRRVLPLAMRYLPQRLEPFNSINFP